MKPQKASLLLGEADLEKDATDSNGRTALFVAVEQDDLSTVNALLASQANPNTADRKGRTIWFPL